MHCLLFKCTHIKNKLVTYIIKHYSIDFDKISDIVLRYIIMKV